MSEPVRVGVLISGRGSNMDRLIAAARAPGYPARIVLVVSNRPQAAGLASAREAGVETAVVDHALFPDRESFERALDARLAQADVEIVCLAGFMRVLTPWFVERWRGRLLNVHPSLLPAFRGLDTHRRALEAGVAEHGASVHHVVPELDAGPVVAQARVPVLPGDDEESLARRVLAAEHELYPKALAEVAAARRNSESRNGS